MAATQLLLFHSPVDRWSGFVRLVLEEKEAEYDVQGVNGLVGENYSPWYLQDFSTTGELPALVHSNKVISNRFYITRYLDKNFRQPQLMPAEDDVSVQVDEWLKVYCG